MNGAHIVICERGYKLIAKKPLNGFGEFTPNLLVQIFMVLICLCVAFKKSFEEYCA